MEKMISLQRYRSLVMLIVVVLVWRLLISLTAEIAIQKLPYKPTFPYVHERLSPYGNRSLTTWAQFDGIHYLTIINHGYKSQDLIQAFFPLYPIMIRYLSFGIINPIIVGILLSTFSLIIGLLLLYQLINADYGESVALKTIIILLFFPTSFFFTSLYTESLFFAFVVGSFVFAKKQKWWLAGILGACAAATRIVGIFLVPALLYEYFEQRNKNKKIDQSIAGPLLPTLGLGSYAYYLQNQFNDALMFYHVQKDFGTSRETSRIILLYQVFYRYVKIFLTVPIHERLFYIVTQEFLAGLLGIVLLIYGWFQIKRSYIIFGLFAYILPTLTGTFSSMPRYILPIFPLYLIIAKKSPPWLYAIILCGMLLMQIINLILFTQGLWVA